MTRKQFLQSLALLPLTASVMKAHELLSISDNFPNTPRMPVLFLGHGSPMNAIEDNEFVKGFKSIAQKIPTPTAILCVSAHWETKGTKVTAMQQPPTIHDFGGFPKALYDVQYPAPGSPVLASLTQQIITQTKVEADHAWGLDHGAWTVIMHLYPEANIPVIQMSIDYTQDAAYHYQLAKDLQQLRHKGILIIGSGNMIHNLGMVAWDKLQQPGYAYDWAIEARETMNQYILQGQHDRLIHYAQQGKAFQLSIPSPEHYLPLLYVLALQQKNEQATLFNDQAMGGSLSMTSVWIHE